MAKVTEARQNEDLLDQLSQEAEVIDTVAQDKSQGRKDD